MFDVGDLPVLTFGNCVSVLMTGVIKWFLKPHTYIFNVLLFYFTIPKTELFTFFGGCCTRILEHWLRPVWICVLRRRFCETVHSTT